MARSLIAVLQALPLPVVARLGRAGGAVFYWCDARHRRVALENLRRCFGAEKSPAEIRALARENFRRIGENFASAVRTACMDAAEIRRHVEVAGAERLLPQVPGEAPQSRVMAVGHFGNFEIYAHSTQLLLGVKTATTYRGLRQPALNRLLQSMRAHTGCRFFERRTDAEALKKAMQETGLLLGLLVDQHAGDHGLPVPFFGRECSTSAAPAVLALRYHWPLHTAICFRTGPARWRVEFGGEIPTRIDGNPRPLEAIARDVNQAFETAIRRDPANWFWVHRRWKPIGRRRGVRSPPPNPIETPAGVGEKPDPDGSRRQEAHL
ncbi:MAG: lysophospholipid acyltransferase family protein [Limisphaerales bacterium]